MHMDRKLEEAIEKKYKSAGNSNSDDGSVIVDFQFVMAEESSHDNN